MVLKRKTIVSLVLAVVLLAVPGYFGWRFLSIHYHRYRMVTQYQHAHNVGPSNPSYSRSLQSYEQHRQALMELGYFVKQQFYLKNITARMPQFEELSQNLQKQFPTQIGKLEGHGYIYGEPTFLVLWIDSSSARDIDNFISQADVK
jgi:hypothetical protein